MRLMVMADIHGILPALQAVLKDVQQFNVDGVIVAGDLTRGPQPNETIRLLRSLSHWTIRGNSDNELLRYKKSDSPIAWHTSRAFALLRWTCEHLDTESLEFIRSLPEQRAIDIPGTAAIRVVHGSPRDPCEALLPESTPGILDIALAQTKEPVLVCGHTHTPRIFERDGRLVLNPGAVSGPLDGFVGAQYALLTWDGSRWIAEHRAVTYDHEAVRNAFQISGLLAQGGALANALLLSIETGENIAGDFLLYARSLANQAGFENCEFIPDDIWEEAAGTFDWNSH
jgi:putative phosphoesterase